jgi:histidine triad (HIT) family protein
MTSETKPDCLFCKIVRREIPATVVFEDDAVLAFNDIAPKAPTHVLFVPKRHLATLSESGPGDEALFGRVVAALTGVARERGIDDYRIVVNNGRAAGQVVFHVHFHLLAGRPFSWPAG